MVEKNSTLVSRENACRVALNGSMLACLVKKTELNEQNFTDSSPLSDDAVPGGHVEPELGIVIVNTASCHCFVQPGRRTRCHPAVSPGEETVAPGESCRLTALSIALPKRC